MKKNRTAPLKEKDFTKIAFPFGEGGSRQGRLTDEVLTPTAEEATPKKHRHLQLKILLIIIGICLLINVFNYISKQTGFLYSYTEKASLFYMQKIFPVLSTPFAWLTEKLTFSFGEVLIVFALIAVPLSIIALAVLMIVGRKGKLPCKKIRHIYGYVYGWIIVYILLTETLNCFILYRTPTFAEIYDYPDEQFTPSQLEELADFLLDKTNALSVQMTRDENGEFVLTADLDETAKQAMLNLAEDYPQLKGYYTTPKAVINSFFMSQQYLMGIYFPFTMEANYNDEMYSLNLPDTVCHELAHTKGFIREDEANFIGFLACTESDNIEYQYSGYLRALKYVLSKCDGNCSQETTDRLYSELSDEVRTDWNANAAYWQEVQESDEGIVSSETVSKVSDKAMETSLKVNGVEDGQKSYGRMVDLLLNWYFESSEL